MVLGKVGGEEEGAYRCWTLWKPGRRGTGTKMTIAFLPWPTSICVLDRRVSLSSVYTENHKSQE